MRIIPIAALIMIIDLATAYEAYDQPLIAVIPLRSLGGISQEEAETVTNLMETGLVKSTFFQVVERSRISEILAAQEYSHTEHIDEDFAVRVGKLLSAEQIVLGTLSRIGGKYFVTAKVIDVATGRTLRAEKEEADSLESIAGQAELLGYVLAGLQLDKSGSKPELRFGELLITTEPDNAEVTVNGISKGESPLLIEKVPFGSYRVAAKNKGMFGSQLLELNREGMLKARIVLNQRLGRLFIRVSEPNVMVKIDGEEMGFLGDGIFSDLSEGEHSLELYGKGLYGKSSFFIKPEQTVTVSVDLDPVGNLYYRFPEGASAVLVNGNGSYSRSLSGEGFIENIPEGVYSIEITRSKYRPRKEAINIEKGELAELVPSLIPTDEYRTELQRQARDRKLSELKAEKQALEIKLRDETERGRNLRTAGFVFYGIGAGFAVGTGATLILHLNSGQQGNSSDTLWGGLSLGLGIAGTISAIVGTMLLLEQPELECIEEKIEQAEKSIVQFDQIR